MTPSQQPIVATLPEAILISMAEMGFHKEDIKKIATDPFFIKAMNAPTFGEQRVFLITMFRRMFFSIEKQPNKMILGALAIAQEADVWLNDIRTYVLDFLLKHRHIYFV